MRPSAGALISAFEVLRNGSRRYESDQTFLNHVYSETSESVSILPFTWNAQTHVEVHVPRYWHEQASDPHVLHFTEKKGWQCDEVHLPPKLLRGSPPRQCGRMVSGKLLQNLTVARTDAECFCNNAYHWWDNYRYAERLAASMSAQSTSMVHSVNMSVKYAEPV